MGMAIDIPAVTRILNEGDPLIAVVGATDAPGKYGGVIYRHLKEKGYRVVPVNPSRATVDGDEAFPSVGVLPVPPDIVNFVVPPPVTLRILDEVADLPAALWVQPGAGDNAVKQRLSTGSTPGVMDACIMVVSKRRSAA